MSKVGLLVAHHELNRGRIVRILRRVGVLQQNGEVGPVMQGTHVQIFDRHIQNTSRPMDLRRHRESRQGRAVPHSRSRVIDRQASLHHRSADRDALQG